MSAAELTLYAVEQELTAYLDTEEMVPAEQLAEFQAALAAKGAAALDKRDAVIRAFQAIDAQIEFCKKERERLADRQKTLENGLKRFRKYLAGVCEATGQKKLEGRIGTISYRKGSQSVEVTDAKLVPLQCAKVTVEFFAEDWQALGDFLDEHGTPALYGPWMANHQAREITPDKKALKQLLEDARAGVTAFYKDELEFAADDEERARIQQQIGDAIAQKEKEWGARLVTGDPTVAVK